MRPRKAPLEAPAKIVELRGEPQGWRTWLERLRGPVRFSKLLSWRRICASRQRGGRRVAADRPEFFTIAEADERIASLRLMASLLDPRRRDLPVIAVATGRADVLQGLLEISELVPLTETIPLLPMPLDRHDVGQG